MLMNLMETIHNSQKTFQSLMTHRIEVRSVDKRVKAKLMSEINRNQGTVAMLDIILVLYNNYKSLQLRLT